MQPYHTLKGSRSLLPSLFKVCGPPLVPPAQSPKGGSENHITPTKIPITAAKNPITTAKKPITAATNPITAAKKPITTAIILYSSFLPTSGCY